MTKQLKDVQKHLLHINSDFNFDQCAKGNYTTMGKLMAILHIISMGHRANF